MESSKREMRALTWARASGAMNSTIGAPIASCAEQPNIEQKAGFTSTSRPPSLTATPSNAASVSRRKRASLRESARCASAWSRTAW